jgi:plasmid stabilization system protein ParE
VEDLAQGAKWYNERSAGLGAQFLDECRAAIDRIVASPELAAAGFREVRSARLHRFPYVVRYRIEGETIVVIAILFGGRDPSAWQNRT